MNILHYYDFFIFIAGLDIDFCSILKNCDPSIKNEVLNYIDFLKKLPSKKDFVNYKISEDALKIYMKIVRELYQKTK